MSIYEYNEEYVRRSMIEVGYEEAKVDMARQLIRSVEAVMENFHVDLEAACKGIGTTLEEYTSAKEEVAKHA